MGNQSCVSCRTTDAKERPLGKKQRPPRDKHSPEADEPEFRNNHEAAKSSACSLSLSSPQNEKPPVIRSPNEVTLTFGGNDVRAATKPTSAWDLYEVLRQHRVKEVDENGVAPVVKAARAIVELNVFLASQVIYPAYLRYLSEDHPDLYTQYFERPESPTPPYTSDGELPVYNSESPGSSPEEPSPTSEGVTPPLISQVRRVLGETSEPSSSLSNSVSSCIESDPGRVDPKQRVDLSSDALSQK